MGKVMSLEDLRAGKVLQGDMVAMRVICGSAKSDHDQMLYIVEEDVGILLPAGKDLEVKGTVISVSVPGPSRSNTIERVRLEDAEVHYTGNRWYRELIRTEITQFVGLIPPGRAPDHDHLYEEVLCVLKGEGIVWFDKETAPIRAGSCVLLPKRQVHCVENTGSDELRLLGVFYPAGSPAVRYTA